MKRTCPRCGHIWWPLIEWLGFGEDTNDPVRLRVIALCGGQPIGEITMFTGINVGDKRYFIVEALDANGNVTTLPGPVTVTAKNPAALSATVNPDGTGGVLTALSAGGAASIADEFVVSSGTLSQAVDFTVTDPNFKPPPPAPAPAVTLRVTETDATGKPLPPPAPAASTTASTVEGALAGAAAGAIAGAIIAEKTS